jgi:hypothetical protein
MRFASEVQEGQDADAKVAGENAARDFVEQGLTYKQAVEKGLIKPHQSPFFRLGAYETFGRASAWKYDEDFVTALGASKVANSTNPQDFDKFEGDFRQKWQKEHLGDSVDPYMASAFGKQADSIVEGYRHNFAEQAGQRLVAQTSEAFRAEAFSIARQGHKEGLSAAQIAERLNLAAKRQNAAGLSWAVINPLLSSAIDSAAKRENDADILKVKDEISLGSGTLAGTSYGSEGTEKAENEIAAVNQSKLAADREEAKAKKEQAMTAVTGDLVTALQGAASPLTVDVKPFIERAVALGEPDKATTLLNIQKAFGDKEYTDDPATMKRLYVGVHSGYTTQGRLDEALAAKALTFATYDHLSNEIKERDKSGREGATAKTAELERVRSRVRGLFIAEYGESNQAERYRAENAASEAVYNYLQWLGTPEGSKATVEQKEQFVHGEALRQFGLKEDPSTVKQTTKNAPEAEFASPARANPKKAPAVPPATLAIIREAYEALQRGERMSREAYAALQQQHVAPNKIKEWLDLQQKYINP